MRMHDKNRTQVFNLKQETAGKRINKEKKFGGPKKAAEERTKGIHKSGRAHDINVK